jgi:hypothetical protein
LFFFLVFSDELGGFSTAEASQFAADPSSSYNDACAAVTDESGAAYESSLDDSRNGTADAEVSDHYNHGQVHFRLLNAQCIVTFAQFRIHGFLFRIRVQFLRMDRRAG